MQYIERSVNEFMALNNLSRKEIKYKLFSKGVQNNLIEDYFSEHQEELYEYEINSAKKIILKKSQTMDKTEINNCLRKKGYTEEAIKEE